MASAVKPSHLSLCNIALMAAHPNAVIRNSPGSYAAQVQPPINPDKSSNWSAKSQGAIPIKFQLFRGAALGGFRVAAGEGWQPFDGNFDALTVGVLGSDTTYDFDGVGLGPSPGGATRTCNLPEAKLKVTKIDPAPDGEVNETPIQSPSDNSGVFRVVDCMYMYNLAIQSLPTPRAGTYRIELQINGTTVDPGGTAYFDLK